MVDIFLSYSSSDRQQIKPIIAGLQAEGLIVFWDHMVPAGQTWRQYIIHRLEVARCVVVVWTKKSIESEWVIEEAEQGKRKGVLLPILLNDIEPPFGFRSIHAASLAHWSGSVDAPEWQELVADIRVLLKIQEQEFPSQLQHEDKILDQINAAYEKNRVEKAPESSDLSAPTHRQLRKSVIGIFIATFLLIGLGWFLNNIGFMSMTIESNEPSASVSIQPTLPSSPSGSFNVSEEKINGIINEIKKLEPKVNKLTEERIKLSQPSPELDAEAKDLASENDLMKNKINSRLNELKEERIKLSSSSELDAEIKDLASEVKDLASENDPMLKTIKYSTLKSRLNKLEEERIKLSQSSSDLDMEITRLEDTYSKLQQNSNDLIFLKQRI